MLAQYFELSLSSVFFFFSGAFGRNTHTFPLYLLGYILSCTYGTSHSLIPLPDQEWEPVYTRENGMPDASVRLYCNQRDEVLEHLPSYKEARGIREAREVTWDKPMLVDLRISVGMGRVVNGNATDSGEGQGPGNDHLTAHIPKRSACSESHRKQAGRRVPFVWATAGPCLGSSHSSQTKLSGELFPWLDDIYIWHQLVLMVVTCTM